MPPNRSTAALRTALADSFSGWLDEVETLLADAHEHGRIELADTLNQAARRLRQTTNFDELAGTLADVASAFAQGAAVLRVEAGKVRGERIRGVEPAREECFRELEISLEAAPALAGAVQTEDPVAAVATATQVSAELLEVAGHSEQERVSIFPVSREGSTEALLYCWGDVSVSNLELLAQVAGLCLPAPPPPPPPPVVEPPELVSIAPAPAAEREAGAEAESPAPEAKPGLRQEWDDLSPEEQAIHLSAQRFARVRVAEIRLNQAEAVHAGRMHRDLYGTLQDSIDRARANFRRIYMDTCPSMVDYVHLELVRTLAYENPRLLGESYPGPLA